MPLWKRAAYVALAVVLLAKWKPSLEADEEGLDVSDTAATPSQALDQSRPPDERKGSINPTKGSMVAGDTRHPRGEFLGGAGRISSGAPTSR
jgi:hypothetical protein